MKKIILSAIAVCAFGFANAQDLKSKKGENYLPEAGEWAISFNATGVFTYLGNSFNGATATNGAPSVTSATPNSFVGKRFITDKTAIRYVANLGFGSNNGTAVSTTVPNTSYSFGPHKVSTLNVSAGLGKEWRRGNTRLQGFYGADALVGFSSTKYTENEGAKQTYDVGTSINLSAIGFIGAEYFLFPKMSIGAQYNYGLQIASNGASKYSATGATEVKGKSTSNTNLGNVTSTSMNLTLHF
jgi:hypothetical protein